MRQIAATNVPNRRSPRDETFNFLRISNAIGRKLEPVIKWRTSEKNFGVFKLMAGLVGGRGGG